MYRYRHDSTSESSDNENHLSLNPIKTFDLSYTLLNAEDVRKHIDEFENSGERKCEYIDTVLLIHNSLEMVPFNVSKFNNLKRLDISNNHITSLPDFICSLPLSCLIAKNNRITNEGLPKSFRNFRNLKVINLSGNNLSRFPEQCLENDSVEFLYLGSNNIIDLPKEIDRLYRLKILCLGGNYLTEIPSTVGSLDNLQGLILSDNALETLPSSIANLKNLKSLLLHKNRLRMLPTEIIALKCLTELSLRENPLVVNFVSDMQHNPPSLLELSGRTIKLHNIEIPEGELPATLEQYLKSAHRCVNPKCKGVFFDNRVEHIKFVDFCGKYRVPLLQYLCSSKCVVNNAALQGSYTDNAMMRKVLLG
ncbi:leucine-rich repeat-containing protein 58 [Planococcus citri]|uniref:leucine-rich repeat-containing protein 58 n=1 Tax=Planococcus citri TaxID=170843 RepID=UPI0031F8E4C2